MNPSSSTAGQHDVIIVGAGPAGLAFARAIAPAGLSIAVIEKNPPQKLADPADDGREIALTHASRGRLESLDIWQRLPQDAVHLLKQARVLNGQASSYALDFAVPAAWRSEAVQSLGFFVSNCHLRRAAWESCQAFSNIHFLTDCAVEEAGTDATEAFVRLADGRRFSSRLLVAADSRFSQLRRQLGIACDIHEFGQQVYVFRAEHALSNEGISSEIFFEDHVLSILPLGPKVSSCVITVPDCPSSHLNTDNAEQLARQVEHDLQFQLGAMTVSSQVFSYPLVTTHARRFHGRRCALIGDAAVGMHPGTAQGFNMGLEGACLLARLIMQADRQGQDIGAEALLRRCTMQHGAKTRALYHGTNLIMKLFTSQSKAASVLRPGVLRLGNHLPGLKSLIAWELIAHR